MNKSLKEEMEELALEQFRLLQDAGIEWAEWVAAGDGEECELCRAADGSKVRVSEVDKPWHEGCTKEYCRCCLIATPSPSS